MQRFFQISLLGMLVTVTTCRAERRRGFSLLTETAFQYSFISPKADQVSNVTYTQKYSSGVIGRLHAGLWFSGPYIGLVYDYWVAGRRYVAGSAAQKDYLRFQSVGAEVGWLWNHNPRLFWLIAAGALYPLQLEVRASANTYGATKLPGGFGRACLGLRLESFLSLLLEVGYRYARLGKFTDNGMPLLPGENVFDLSGPFISMGLMLVL